MNELQDRLIAAPVIPLIQAADTEIACATANALAEGGLGVAEVVLRTTAALSCVEAIGSEVPDTLVGAGTVLNAQQCHDAIAAGAQFIVSPGLDDGVITTAIEHGVPVFPGTATATDVQRASNLNLRTIKFFPAKLAGGTSMLKALASVFRDMHFIPTGGVSAANLSAYLALPCVAACGGSWMTPPAAIDAGDFDTVTRLATEAVEIATRARGQAARR